MVSPSLSRWMDLRGAQSINVVLDGGRSLEGSFFGSLDCFPFTRVEETLFEQASLEQALFEQALFDETFFEETLLEEILFGPFSRRACGPCMRCIAARFQISALSEIVSI
jgi:hypothetical protein